MAEIKIEKKKKPLWPWILLAIVVIALILLFAVPWDDEEDYERVAETEEMINTKDKSDISGEREENQTVLAYIGWMDENIGQMGIDHELTHRALTDLANAIQSLATEIGFNLEVELDQAREYADQIKEDPYETSHADKIRKAADMISKAQVNMQEAKYSGLKQEALEVQDAASRINPEELTLDQKEEVKNFFRKATDLLQEMN